jgi:hypothetical protein
MENEDNSNSESLQTQVQMLKKAFESLSVEYYKNNFSSHQDFNKSTSFNTKLKVPSYSVAPSTCEVGEIIEVGGKLCICSSTDTFTIVGTQS